MISRFEEIADCFKQIHSFMLILAISYDIQVYHSIEKCPPVSSLYDANVFTGVIKNEITPQRIQRDISTQYVTPYIWQPQAGPLKPLKAPAQHYNIKEVLGPKDIISAIKHQSESLSLESNMHN